MSRPYTPAFVAVRLNAAERDAFSDIAEAMRTPLRPDVSISAVLRACVRTTHGVLCGGAAQKSEDRDARAAEDAATAQGAASLLHDPAMIAAVIGGPIN